MLWWSLALGLWPWAAAWIYRSGGRWERPRALEVTEKGDLLVAGDTRGEFEGFHNRGERDVFIMALNETGHVLWTRQRGCTSDDYAMGLAVNSKGELILAGYTGGSLDDNPHHGVDDLFVMKFDGFGTWLWTHQRGTRFEDRITCIQVLQRSDDVVVAGHTKGTLDGNVNMGDADLFIMKFNSEGLWQWTRQRGSDGYDYVAALHLDQETGATHLVGFTSGSLDGHMTSGGDDLFALHLADDGTWRWTQQRGTHYEDRATAMAVMGEVMYVTGYTKGSLDGTSHGDADLFLMKLASASGEHLWTCQVGSHHFDAAMAIRVRAVDNFPGTQEDHEVLMVGCTQGSLFGTPNRGMDDIFIQSFHPNGTQLRMQQTGSPEPDCGTALVVTGGEAFLAGYVGHHVELFISTLSSLPLELVSLAQIGARVVAAWTVFTAFAWT